MARMRRAQRLLPSFNQLQPLEYLLYPVKDLALLLRVLELGLNLLHKLGEQGVLLILVGKYKNHYP